MLLPKKVGTLPVENSEEIKRTNEIKTVIPLLEEINIEGKNLTFDALLTQRSLAEYIEMQNSFYFFTVKLNQPTLYHDIELYFQDRGEPDFIEHTPPDHGRIEIRKIWVTTELNDYIKFPYVRQVYAIEREVIHKKEGRRTVELVFGITNCPEYLCKPCGILKNNRGHWVIENSCHYVIDWNYNEDRSRIRIGHGPENLTRLRRFCVGIIQSKGVRSVAQKMRELTMNVRLVLDYLRLTKNSSKAGKI